MEAGDLSEDMIFRRLAEGGFEPLLELRLAVVADYLEDRSVATGFVVPMLLAQAIRTVGELMDEHDNYGGVRIGFARQLDELAKSFVPRIQSADRSGAATIAKEFRDEVRARVRSYDVELTYE